MTMRSPRVQMCFGLLDHDGRFGCLFPSLPDAEGAQVWTLVAPEHHGLVRRAFESAYYGQAQEVVVRCDPDWYRWRFHPVADPGHGAVVLTGVRLDPCWGELTARERQLVEMMAVTGDVDAVAKSLGVSADTVKSHQRAIMRKAGLNEPADFDAFCRAFGCL